jgi:hypothetical protein
LISMHFGASHDEIAINGQVYDRSVMNDIQKRRLIKDVRDVFAEHTQGKDRRRERLNRKKADRHAA